MKESCERKPMKKMEREQEKLENKWRERVNKKAE